MYDSPSQGSISATIVTSRYMYLRNARELCDVAYRKLHHEPEKKETAGGALHLWSGVTTEQTKEGAKIKACSSGDLGSASLRKHVHM